MSRRLGETIAFTAVADGHIAGVRPSAQQARAQTAHAAPGSGGHDAKIRHHISPRSGSEEGGYQRLPNNINVSVSIPRLSLDANKGNRLSLYLQRTDPLRWTPYFADILKELRIKPEWSGDLILSHQVEMQLVVERAKSVNLYDVGLSTSETPKLPASAFLQLFQAQLDEVKNSFSGDKQANGGCLCHADGIQLTTSQSSFGSTGCTTLRTSMTWRQS